MNNSIKFYSVDNNTAYIDGSSKYGPYAGKPKSAKYGMNAMYAYKYDYIRDLGTSLNSIEADKFESKNPQNMTDEEFDTYIAGMEKEVKKLEETEFPPINFVLKYAPKMGAVKAFFSRLFTGSSVDRQALLGHSFEEMDRNTHISVEKADEPFKDKAFSDINADLTSKAFDVNNDGELDVSEMAISTVIADVLSKDEALDPMEITVSDLKKADGTYTNDGENRMMAFCKEENLETASGIAKEIHTKMKLKKAEGKFYRDMFSNLRSGRGGNLV